MSDIEKAYHATPSATLEQQIMDTNFPKNEREWWAADEIDRQRTTVLDLLGQVGQLSDEITRLRSALETAADRLFDAGLNDAWADARAALEGK